MTISSKTASPQTSPPALAITRAVRKAATVAGFGALASLTSALSSLVFEGAMSEKITFSSWVEYLTPALGFDKGTMVEAIDKAHRRGAMDSSMADRLAKLFGVSDQMGFGLGALTARLQIEARAS